MPPVASVNSEEDLYLTATNPEPPVPVVLAFAPPPPPDPVLAVPAVPI